MILEEQGIIDFTKKIREKRFNLNELKIKYNPDERNPYALLNVHAVDGVHQDDTYYDNLQENIIASNFSWFEPICRFINTPLEAILKVDEDGNFIIGEIKIKFDIYIPKRVDSTLSFLYNRIKPFVMLNEYLDSVHLWGYEGKLSKISFLMNIDARKINKLLKERALNRSILDQWLSVINRCEKENTSSRQYENKYDVVSGKINMEYKYELVSHYFGLSSNLIKEIKASGVQR